MSYVSPNKFIRDSLVVPAVRLQVVIVTLHVLQACAIIKLLILTYSILL